LLLVALAGCAETQSMHNSDPTPAMVPAFGGAQVAREKSFVPSGPMFSSTAQ
jgi:hypothetical protein